MQVTSLFSAFDGLHAVYGDPTLHAIYGAWCTQKPRLCLVFMNPTGRNVSAYTNWQGIRAPWIGTKNVWRMFHQLGIISSDIYNLIRSKKSQDWDEDFALYVYEQVAQQGIYITNLSKATQVDARPLPDSIFYSYIDLFKQEVSIVKPDVIITFGNQVSSVLLGTPISVSQWRKKSHELPVHDCVYDVFPVYYPVGQGMRNMSTAQEDIGWIMDNYL